MDVFEAIWTLRAMRRLDPDRAVPEDDLRAALEAASKAPSGGNSQPVEWVVVRDATMKRKLGEIYRVQARKNLAVYEEPARTNPEVASMLRSSLHLADHLGEAPVLLIPCAPASRIRVEGAIYPAIQNLMLAARALGLGTTLTSMHRDDEQSVKDLLGIPADMQTFAIIPMGYPLGRWGEAKRRPIDETTHWERWGGSSGPDLRDHRA